jgi:glutathione S-transferase
LKKGGPEMPTAWPMGDDARQSASAGAAAARCRDVRHRALEEAGIAYAVRKLDAMAERPADYYREQPFGQVPSYRDDTVLLFESAVSA